MLGTQFYRFKALGSLQFFLGNSFGPWIKKERMSLVKFLKDFVQNTR